MSFAYNSFIGIQLWSSIIISTLKLDLCLLLRSFNFHSDFDCLKAKVLLVLLMKHVFDHVISFARSISCTTFLLQRLECLLILF